MTAPGVRDVTARRFDTALVELADDHATGALYGRAGVVYLCDGVVVHVESPSAPDLGVRLIACGRLDPEMWRRAVAEAGRDRRVGGFLVEHGCLTRGELELCHLGAVFDAGYFTLLPESRPTRFLSGASHWLGPVRPVRAEVLRREAGRRRALLDRVWPWPASDEEPVVPRPGGDAHSGHGTGPTRSQRDVLELADGSRTPAQIAWLLGRSAFTTVLDVRRLAAAGLIETPRQRTAVPTAQRPAQDRLPQTTAPDISLLIRLRDALEAM
jgi:hypothetical protein